MLVSIVGVFCESCGMPFVSQKHWCGDRLVPEHDESVKRFQVAPTLVRGIVSSLSILVGYGRDEAVRQEQHGQTIVTLLSHLEREDLLLASLTFFVQFVQSLHEKIVKVLTNFAGFVRWRGKDETVVTNYQLYIILQEYLIRNTFSELLKVLSATFCIMCGLS